MRLEIHAPKAAENGNNIVETQFESRLKFQPVESVDELNTAASAWANAYCANLIPGQDNAPAPRWFEAPIARYDL